MTFLATTCNFFSQTALNFKRNFNSQVKLPNLQKCDFLTTWRWNISKSTKSTKKPLRTCLLTFLRVIINIHNCHFVKRKFLDFLPQKGQNSPLWAGGVRNLWFQWIKSKVGAVTVHLSIWKLPKLIIDLPKSDKQDSIFLISSHYNDPNSAPDFSPSDWSVTLSTYHGNL